MTIKKSLARSIGMHGEILNDCIEMPTVFKPFMTDNPINRFFVIERLLVNILKDEMKMKKIRTGLFHIF